MKTLRMDKRLTRWFNITLGGKLRAVTVDVSEFGFCAELTPVFLPGSVVDGTVQVREQVFPFKGEVSWAEPGKHRSRIGVRFTNVSEDYVRCLYAPSAGAA